MRVYFKGKEMSYFEPDYSDLWHDCPICDDSINNYFCDDENCNLYLLCENCNSRYIDEVTTKQQAIDEGYCDVCIAIKF